MKEFIVFTAINDKDWADEFVTSLLEENLITSASFIPDVEVMYNWEGHVQVDSEYKLMLKTFEDKLPQIEDFLVDRHPYIVPEFIAMEVSFGSPGFRLKVTEKINKNMN